MKNTNIKNKYFLPLVLLSIVTIAVSLFSITNKKNITDIKAGLVKMQPKEEVITFSWEKGEKPVLLMTASKEVSIGAIDLYIGYKGVDVLKVDNLDEIPNLAFSKVSEKNDLVVMNYLISENEGFKLIPGQSIRVIELEISPEISNMAELFIDNKTNVVENDSVEMVPYKSENLIINSTL